MIFRSALILLAFSLWSGSVAAQQAEALVFNEKTHDFGAIEEEGGPVIHEFNFINKGLNPVKIIGVKASCGCTTPDWTKDIVNPGETGFVQAQYNPKNRPGAFHKSLTVTIEGSSSPVKLYIQGRVEPKTKSIAEELPTEMGGLRVRYRSFNMGKVKTTDVPSIKEFDVYNSSDTLITFLEKVLAPAHIKIEFDPQTLEPGKTGTIRLIYDAKLKNDLGFSSDNVKFFTNESGNNATKSVSIYATTEEYFPPMTKQELELAPKLHITEKVHDFGRIESNEVVSTSFTITNNGLTPLNIRQIKSNCSCTSAVVEQATLEPGEVSAMQVTFNAEGRKGNQQKSVTIYSDDPTASAQRVTVKAYILQDN